MSLKDKSLTELRGIAQSFGIPLKFDMDKPHLIQAIELKQAAMIPEPKIGIPMPQYDPRIMKKVPARKCDRPLLEELLKPYVERGLRVEYQDETWRMSFNKRTDTGTLRQPPRIIMKCAEAVLNG